MDLPIFYSFACVVHGRTFSAIVRPQCRALMFEEDGVWWFSGVEPGGLMERGDIPIEAKSRFKAAFQETIEEIAAEVADFQAFDNEVKRFFADRDEVELGRWEEALEAIRSGAVIPPAPFDKLPRERGEKPSGVSCQPLDKSTPVDLSADERIALAPAA